jgi:uncharacterized protein YraI
MPRALFFRIAAAVTLGFAALSSVAAADTAWTVHRGNLRAGPSQEYEVVNRLPPQTQVEVAGCVEGVTWCDVIAGPDRGWMYAGNLEFPYEGRRVVILEHSAWWHAPIVPFAVGPYWDTYYVGRPWYGRRSYWVSHPYVAHPYGGHAVVVHPGHPGVVAPHSVVVHPGPRHETVHHEAVHHEAVHSHHEDAHPAPHHEAAHPAPAHPAPKAPAPKHEHPKHQ